MSKAIALANQKGGTGKTTTTVNLGIGLAVFEDILSLNNKQVRLYKVSGKNTFSIWVYSKK